MLALPGFLQELAELVGEEEALNIGRAFAGKVKSFPRRSTLARWQRNKAIIADYDGYNTGKLAWKYKLSISQVLRIVKHVPKPEE
jgi:Mor family transcriptional regulator